MRYSIITPTLVRPTLARLCESIDRQTNGDWEHIIMVDVPLIVLPAKRAIVDSFPKDPRRKFYRCGKAHKNYGNTCRWNAWEKAKGDYILYLDDDDFYADERVFETLEQVTAPWAIFPCMRVGDYWFHDPPGLLKTGSNMFMHKRDIGRYPNVPDYCADGMLVEDLKKYTYQAVTDRPLTIYERANRGRE